MINKIDDSMLRTLLIERYINNKKWDDVADSINYSWSQTHRNHKKALEAVYKANETEFDKAF